MLRYDDSQRTLTLSVGDLVRSGPPEGHLTLQSAGAGRARLAAGQWVHTQYQTARELEEAGFTREVALKIQQVVRGWTIELQGRVDGLVEAGGTWIVEEVKSTALDGVRLATCRLEDWPDYVRQLQIYLWMLQRAQPAHRIVGELILVSLSDATRRSFPVEPDPELDTWIEDRLDQLIEAREDRLAWMAERRTIQATWPHASVREGQQQIVDEVTQGLQEGRPVLVQAPTGLGKTVAVLLAAVRHALATDRQVFWATTRTTQQPLVERTLLALEQAGAPIRAVFLNARPKVCLNTEAPLDCRPESCAFADSYFEKLREQRVLQRLRGGRCTRDVLEGAGLQHCVCPYQLARDLAPMVDVVIGDTNYVFDPSSRLKSAFDEAPEKWIVVCDEAHQLMERARAYRSPRIDGRLAQQAAEFLHELGPQFGPFAFLARQIEDAVVEAQHQVTGPVRGSEGVAELSPGVWDDLADRVEELALDYALLKAEHPEVHEDPWLQLTWQLQRFHTVLTEAEEESVAIVDATPGREAVGICCLDPSRWLGPRIAALGGFVCASATLSPTSFHRDLLGLSPDLLEVDVPSPFPPERQLVLVAPRVSTAYADREAHVPAIAELITGCIDAVPGNIALFFSSFDLLRQVTALLEPERHRILLQSRSMDEKDREDLLAQLQGEPAVLAAVLGGIFAEGIDLPPGALDAVFVCGPAYPPVGLERDLLRGWYEERYEAGFLYASLVPGLTRVVQAAGRLIRRPEDRGAVLLIGRRFRWRDVAALFPENWNPEIAPDEAARLREFFASTPSSILRP